MWSLGSLAWVTPQGGEPARLGPGDVAVLSGGAAYVVSGGPATEPGVLVLITALRAWLTPPGAQVPARYRAHGDPVVGTALRLLHEAPPVRGRWPSRRGGRAPPGPACPAGVLTRFGARGPRVNSTPEVL